MSSSHAALIVDSDPKGLEALVYGFQGADWRITACPAPETASLLVKASGAEIVVIASRAEHDKAHGLIRQLRAKGPLSTLPILVLGPEDQRKSLKDAGDVDLLPLPAFVRDVLTASQLLVEASSTDAPKPGQEPGFATAIGPTTTVWLIRTMMGLGRSGILHLERKGHGGEISFHEGEVTAAEAAPLQGMAAVQRLLIWNDGIINLRLRPVVRRGQVRQSAQEFIEELDRFQRDFAHAIKDIGPLATVYSRNDKRLQQSPDVVPAEVTPVVRLCDGQRNLSDIIDESPFHVLDTVRVLGRLVDLALLVRRDPRPEDNTKTARSPLDEFWETARIAGSTPARTSQPGFIVQATPAPPPSAPAATADRPTEPAPRAESEARGEGVGRPRKKTLEIAVKAASASEAPPTTEASAPVTGTLSGISPRQPGNAPSPFAPAPRVAAPAATQTSGTIELGERRSRAGTMPHRSSVVVDTAQIEISKPEATPSVANSVTPAPLAVPGHPAQAPVSPGPPVAAPTPNAASRIAGEIHIAPSRKTARNTPAQSQRSIQLDDSLAPEPAKASSSMPSPAPSTTESGVVRVTGEMQVSPSGKTAKDADKRERVSSSFHIDPSLSAEALAQATPPQTDPSPDGPAPSSPEERHQSGNFSPIEKDFFEREAELYKVEKAESFADLEEKRNRRNLKSSPVARSNGRKRK